MAKVRSHIRVCEGTKLLSVELRPVWLTRDGERVVRYRREWRIITDDNRLDLASASLPVDKDDVDFSAIAPAGVNRPASDNFDRKADVGRPLAARSPMLSRPRPNPENAEIRIPHELRSAEIATLLLGRRLENALLKGGIEQLEDLHSLSLTELEEVPGIGPRGLHEIHTALRKLSTSFVTQIHPDPEPVVPSATYCSDMLEIPASHRGIRFADLVLPGALQTALTRGQLKTLGDLADTPSPEVTQRIGRSGLQRITELTAVLSVIPINRLLRLRAQTDGESSLIPQLVPQILTALAGADSFAVEIQSLVSDMDERNAGFFLCRLPFGTVSQPTLESLAQSADVSRERVRQVVSKRNRVLKNSQLRLPIASRMVEILDESGGLQGTHGYLELLKNAGFDLRADDIAALPGLAALNLIPAIEYRPAHELWITSTGLSEWIETDRLREFARSLRKKARPGLRRVGAVPMEDLGDFTPLVSSDVGPVAAPRGTSLGLALGYLIPNPAYDSSLVRSVDKALAVCGSLSLIDLRAGLTRWRRLGEIPPVDVLNLILGSHDDYAVEHGLVRWTVTKPSAAVLAESEAAAVEIFRAAGNILWLWDFVDAMEAAGFSTPTAQLALRRPYVRHRSSAIYSLRGHDIPPSAVRSIERKRRESRSANVIKAEWNGADRFEVHYSLGRYQLQGILGVPPNFSTRRESWRGRLPSGRTVELTLRNGFLWNLKKWLDSEDAEEGDNVFAVFLPGQAIIEFELVKG